VKGRNWHDERRYDVIDLLNVERLEQIEPEAIVQTARGLNGGSAQGEVVQKEEIKAELTREPFVPFRLHLSDGRTFDVPFREVAHMTPSGVLVFIGLKEGTHRAEGYDRFGFDHVVRIEPRPTRGKGKRRKKAS